MRMSKFFGGIYTFTACRSSHTSLTILPAFSIRLVKRFEKKVCSKIQSDLSLFRYLVALHIPLGDAISEKIPVE